MLKKRRQQKRFDVEWESMLTHLSDFYATRRPEALHRFRIQIKKVNTMLFFLEAIPDASQMKALQSIFRHAGRIRNTQINLQLIEQYHLANADIKKTQQQKLDNEARRFYRKREAYLHTLKKLQHRIAGNFHNIDNRAVVGLYKKRLRKLGRFFAKNDIQTNRLHPYRKKIKSLLYLHDVLPKSLVRKLHLNTAWLDHLQDAIGKWHDVESAVELLEMESEPAPHDIAALRQRSRHLLAVVREASEGFGKKAQPHPFDRPLFANSDP